MSAPLASSRSIICVFRRETAASRTVPSKERPGSGSFNCDRSSGSARGNPPRWDVVRHDRGDEHFDWVVACMIACMGAATIMRLSQSDGLRPSDSPTRALARRFDGALRSRDSLAMLARILE